MVTAYCCHQFLWGSLGALESLSPSIDVSVAQSPHEDPPPPVGVRMQRECGFLLPPSSVMVAAHCAFLQRGTSSVFYSEFQPFVMPVLHRNHPLDSLPWVIARVYLSCLFSMWFPKYVSGLRDPGQTFAAGVGTCSPFRAPVLILILDSVYSFVPAQWKPLKHF